MVIHTKKKATLHIVKKKCKDKPKHKIKLASFAKSRRVKLSNGYVNNPRLRKLKLDRKVRAEALPKKKGTINSNVKAVSAVGASATFDQMEGGNEVNEAAMVAYGVAQPVAGVTKKNSEIYRSGMRRMKIKGLVEGRVNKELKETVLLDQVYVKAEDGKQSVGAYVQSVAKAEGVTFEIKRFVRYETGEGLEKKQEDFAAEVAAQMGN